MEANKGKFFEIISNDREDDKWDFKEDLILKSKKQINELIKDILAFSNSGGGFLLLGINDKNHDLVGVTNKIDEADLANKIESVLGYRVDIKLTYFTFENENDGEIDLGIMHIPNANRIFVSPKDLSDEKRTVVQSNVVYVRKNTRSIKANGDDLHELAYKISKKGQYIYSEMDIEILERNKDFASFRDDIENFLSGKFKFSSISFSRKLHELYTTYQVDYNKLEFAMLLGLDEENIDNYFEGKAVPKLEHLLRATEIFNLPPDYFFTPTIQHRKTLWYEPTISYTIIDKVTNKGGLFDRNFDNGKFFYTVFYNLIEALFKFSDWLESERMEKPTDEVELIFSNYNSLYDYTSVLSDEELYEFKKHLSSQYYKLLELVEGINGRNREERFASNLAMYSEDFICRIINEAIQEITLNNDQTPAIVFTFFYELENLILRGRSYNNNKIKLELTEGRQIKGSRKEG